MRKTILAIIFVNLIGLNGLAFAETYQKTIHGTNRIVMGQIESVNGDNGTFTVKDRDTRKDKTIFATAAQLEGLNVGDSVKVTLPVAGNVAKKVVK